jgi:hypothetical protein
MVASGLRTMIARNAGGRALGHLKSPPYGSNPSGKFGTGRIVSPAIAESRKAVL